MNQQEKEVLQAAKNQLAEVNYRLTPGCRMHNDNKGVIEKIDALLGIENKISKSELVYPNRN